MSVSPVGITSPRLDPIAMDECLLQDSTLREYQRLRKLRMFFLVQKDCEIDGYV